MLWGVLTQHKNFFPLKRIILTSKFRNIEIWENTGDLTNPNYQGTLLDDTDDHQFFNYDYGAIIRINHEQCKIIEVTHTTTEAKTLTTSMELELSGVTKAKLEILTLIVTVMLITI